MREHTAVYNSEVVTVEMDEGYSSPPVKKTLLTGNKKCHIKKLTLILL